MERHLQTSLKSSHRRLHVTAFLIDFLNGAGYVYITLILPLASVVPWLMQESLNLTSQLQLFLVHTLKSPEFVSAIKRIIIDPSLLDPLH